MAGTGSQSGSITVTIQGATASAVLRLASGTSNLNGTADAAGTTVSLSGGGFALTGRIAGGGLSGTYTGPGNTTGGFAALNATGATVTRYCGTYTSVAPLNPTAPNLPPQIYTETGTFNVQVSSSGSVSGLAASISPDAACCQTLQGTVSGNTITVTTSDGGTGTATISGGTVSGTGATPSGRGTVTFSGSSSACP